MIGGVTLPNGCISYPEIPARPATPARREPIGTSAWDSAADSVLILAGDVRLQLTPEVVAQLVCGLMPDGARIGTDPGQVQHGYHFVRLGASQFFAPTRLGQPLAEYALWTGTPTFQIDRVGADITYTYPGGSLTVPALFRSPARVAVFLYSPGDSIP